MADAQGNTLEAVDVQLTGFAAVNFDATTIPTAEQLAGDLPTGYEYVGLFMEDGGYSEDVENGDTTNFFQQGYSIQTGDRGINGTLTPAEDNAVVEKLTGVVAGVRSDISYQGTFGLIIATKFTNGRTRVRAGLAQVTEVSPAGEERGGILSTEVSFKWQYQDAIGGYYRQVTIDTPAP